MELICSNVVIIKNNIWFAGLPDSNVNHILAPIDCFLVLSFSLIDYELAIKQREFTNQKLPVFCFQSGFKQFTLCVFVTGTFSFPFCAEILFLFKLARPAISLTKRCRINETPPTAASLHPPMLD